MGVHNMKGPCWVGGKLLIWFGEFNHGKIESLWFYMMNMHAGKLNGYDFMQWTNAEIVDLGF